MFNLDTERKSRGKREAVRGGRDGIQDGDTKQNVETAQASTVTHCHPDQSKAKKTSTKKATAQHLKEQ